MNDLILLVACLGVAFCWTHLGLELYREIRRGWKRWRVQPFLRDAQRERDDFWRHVRP